MTFKNVMNYVRGHSAELRNEFRENGLKATVANVKAGMSISSLGVECIGILVLVIVFILVPVIGDAVFAAMPAVNSSAWGDITGPELWATLSPMIQVTAIVLIAALVIKAIYDFRKGAQ